MVNIDKLTTADLDFFWSKVDKNGPIVRPELGPCWIWTGATGSTYGSVSFGKRGGASAHRLSFRLVRGPIPEGALLRHACDVPVCVRPEHLIPGTNKQNAHDRDSRGRLRGGKVARFGPRFSLTMTPEQLAALKAGAARSGESEASFARRAILDALRAIGITVPSVAVEPAKAASRSRRRGAR